MGWLMAVRTRGKHYLTNFGHQLALDSRGYGLVMNLAWLFFINIILVGPKNSTFVVKSCGWVVGSPMTM